MSEITESAALAWCSEHHLTIHFLKEDVRIVAPDKTTLLGKGATIFDAYQDALFRCNPERRELATTARDAFYGYFMATPSDTTHDIEEYGEIERWASVIKAIVQYLKTHELPTCYQE